MLLHLYEAGGLPRGSGSADLARSSPRATAGSNLAQGCSRFKAIFETRLSGHRLKTEGAGSMSMRSRLTREAFFAWELSNSTAGQSKGEDGK